MNRSRWLASSGFARFLAFDGTRDPDLRPSGQAGKSREPAGWKACPTWALAGFVRFGRAKGRRR